MKYTLCALIFCFPVFVFSQVVDTVEIGREVDSLLRISEELYGKGEYQKMYAAASMAVEKAERHLEYQSMRVANGLNNAGAAKIMLGNMDTAIVLLKEAVNIQRKISGPGNAAFVESLNNLGVVYMNMGHYTDAEQSMLEVKNNIDSKSKLYPGTLNNLATIFVSLGRFAEAEPLLMQAKTFWRTH